MPVGLAWLCVAVFFAVFVPPALRDLGPASLASNSDLQSYFLPKYAFGSDELLRGRLPAWNLYEYAGLPFLATAQPAVFYPPKILLYAVLSPTAAHWVFLIGHYLLAAYGFVAFARELGLRREAALVGAVAFLFSVPVLAGNYHPTRIANLTWLPFIFLCVTRIVRGGGFAPFAWLSAVVALQLSAGYPEFTLDTALFVGLYVIALWLADAPARPRWAAPFIVGAAFALGGLISAIEILPLVEIGAEAKRAAVTSAALGPAQPARSFSVLSSLPYPFYVPGLIGFAALSPSSRKGWPAFLSVAFCAVLTGTGAADLLLKLPGFSMIRFPFAFVLVTMFFPAWAAAAGADAVLRAPEESASKRRALVALALLGSAALLVFYAVRLPRLLRGEEVPFQNTSGCVLSLVGVLLLGGAATALAKHKLGAQLLVAGTLLLVLAQLVVFPFKAAPAPFARPAPHGEVARLLGSRARPEGRAFSLYDILYGYNVTDRIPSVFGIEESFLPWRFRQLHDRVRLIPFLGYVDTPALLGMTGFLDAMNLEYLALKNAEAPLAEREGFTRVARDDRSTLLRNPDRMGAAWVNYAVRRFQSESAVLDYISGRGFDPHREVVVSTALKGSYPEISPSGATPVSQLRRPSPTELELTAELPQPGVLVLADAAYPGWRATVDGKPAAWFEADYVLRGLELDAGKHQVRFEYHSKALRLGSVLSIGGLVLLGLAFAMPRVLRARRSAS